VRRPDLLIAADTHIDDRQPLCRTDDFRAAMIRKIKFLGKVQKRWDRPVPLVIAGDVFDRPNRQSLEVIVAALVSLPNFYGVAGQHDLPGHSYDQLLRSALGILVSAGKTSILEPKKVTKVNKHFLLAGSSWAQPLPTVGDVAVLHRFTYMGRAPWPGCPKEARVSWLMNKLSAYKLIITGDNHKPFTYKHRDGRLLVNPGSMMRRTADQIKHRPRIYAWYKKTNTVEPIYYPIKKGVVTRDHIDPKQELDKRINEFIARLDREYEVGLSFEKNMDEFLATNKVASPIKKIIQEAIVR